MNAWGSKSIYLQLKFRNAIYCYRVLIDKNPVALHALTRAIDLGATRKQIFTLLKENAPEWMMDFVESLFCQQTYNFQGTKILLILKMNLIT